MSFASPPRPSSTVPQQHVPAGSPGKQQRNAASAEELRLHLDRCLAENALLGRTLRDAQAERKAQHVQLLTCQAQCADLQQQLKESKTRNVSLQRQLEQLTVAGAKQAEHLQQSHTQRQELEELTRKLQAQVTQQATQLQEWAASQNQPPTNADLRQEVARLEDLYATKLQVVQQQADARLQDMQAQAQDALHAAEAEARAALAQLHEEVQRQVHEAEGSLTRQLHQQDRVVQQLEKRCIALEKWVRSAALSSDVRSTHTGYKPDQTQAAPKGTASAGASSQGQHRVTQVAAMAAEAAALTVSKHKQQATEAVQRLQHVKHELVTSLEQHHELLSEHAALQHQALTATSNLAAAEAAIQDLRGALSGTRERLLVAQATTVAEAVCVAARGHAQGTATDGEQVSLASNHTATYVRVLEHAVREADAREAALKRAMQESTYLEEQARRLLAGARDEQLAMRRALEKQVRRCHALEEVRLQDAKLLASLSPA